MTGVPTCALPIYPDMTNDFVHTEREAKAMIFWDQIKQNGLFSCRGSGDKSLVPLNVMAKPNAAQLKAFGRACDILRTKGLVKETLKFQLVKQDEDMEDI